MAVKHKCFNCLISYSFQQMCFFSILPTDILKYPKRSDMELFRLFNNPEDLCQLPVLIV